MNLLMLSDFVTKTTTTYYEVKAPEGLYTIVAIIFVFASILTIICRIGQIATVIAYAFDKQIPERADLYKMVIIISLSIILFLLLIFLMNIDRLISFMQSPITNFLNDFNNKLSRVIGY